MQLGEFTAHPLSSSTLTSRDKALLLKGLSCITLYLFGVELIGGFLGACGLFGGSSSGCVIDVTLRPLFLPLRVGLIYAKAPAGCSDGEYDGDRQ